MIISDAAKEAITIKLEKQRVDVQTLSRRTTLSEQEEAELKHKQMHLEALEWVLNTNKV